jgi:hypothetical protein
MQDNTDYNPDDSDWYLKINWTPFLDEIFDPHSNISIRPTEAACFRNMVRECRRFEWGNHLNNPLNKNYDIE